MVFRCLEKMLPMSFARWAWQLQRSIQIQRHPNWKWARHCCHSVCIRLVRQSHRKSRNIKRWWWVQIHDKSIRSQTAIFTSNLFISCFADYDMATQRMCVQRGPSDSEDRCAHTIYNYKKVYMCFCQGDLCNTAADIIAPSLVKLASISMAVITRSLAHF